KGQIAITPCGVVSASTVVPANVDKRQSLWDISSSLSDWHYGRWPSVKFR
ncbi:MAG: hypothetical protein FD142_3151, partial [bacterium]